MYMRSTKRNQGKDRKLNEIAVLDVEHDADKQDVMVKARAGDLEAMKSAWSDTERDGSSYGCALPRGP